MIQLCACVWWWPHHEKASFHFSREGSDSWAFPSHVRNVMKEIANSLPLDLTSLSVISAFLFFIGKFIDYYKCGIFIIFLFFVVVCFLFSLLSSCYATLGLVWLNQLSYKIVEGNKFRKLLLWRTLKTNAWFREPFVCFLRYVPYKI